ncbi:MULTISPECIES: tetratricopeptide repeat protein [Actinomadura]|uniref:Tetratricopeptide repeat protein n=1 Tax=Actinomadura yumaensis TaxID=111807 RepID=A0ABW2CCW5_9ACTN|nr:tetratricopeptide repeat protein [Actinomadura sp. J1-007]MWK38045.1 tetratricopeptide repeat protein [Actinomadura sp. J1-007]
MADAGLVWTAVGTVGTVASLGFAWVQVRTQRAGAAAPEPEAERGAADIFGMSVAVPTGALPVEVRGRDAVLGELKRWAARPGSAGAAGAAGAVVVLAGMGGQGKTTLATALAGHRAARGKPVWWVSAADRSSLAAGLVTVARRLGASRADLEAIAYGAGDAPDRLWALLERAPAGWLLVLDNADEPGVLAGVAAPGDGTGWLRPSKRGLTVVTSRDADPGTWGRHAVVRNVGALGEDDAALVLLDLAPRAGSVEGARALARRLGCLALALRLAGGYLNSGGARWRTFDEYRHALDDGDGLGRLDGGGDPRTVVMRTWEISLDGLERDGFPLARTLLRLLSCFAPATPIPYGLLDPPLVPASERDVERALDGLARFGLIECRDRGIAVHPLVADTNRAHLDGAERARVAGAAADLVAAAVRRLSLDRPGDWPAHHALGPHLHAVFGSVADALDRARLAALAGSAREVSEVLRMTAAAEAGERLCLAALPHLDGRGPGALALRHELGRLTAARGRWTEAAEAYTRLLPEMRDVLGADDPGVLALRHDLGWVTAVLGRLDEAEEIFRGLLPDRVRVSGADARGAIDTRHEIAWVAGVRGRWTEAEAGYREVLRDRRRLLGDDHPDTLITVHELAWALSGQGRLDEAEAVHRDNLRTRRRVLGDDHPRTFGTRHELAWLDALRGRWADAERRYRALLADRRRALGDDHPDTLATRHELAWTAASQGRADEAAAAYAHLLRARERVLGADHPDTRATATALAELRRGRVHTARHLA